MAKKTQQHTELAPYLPVKKTRPKQLGISVRPACYKKLKKISKELGAPMSRTLEAIIDFYDDPENSE